VETNPFIAAHTRLTKVPFVPEGSVVVSSVCQ